MCRMKVCRDAHAPIPFDLHLACENRAAHECARRVTPCPPTVRAPCVDEVSRSTPALRPESIAPRGRSPEERAKRPDAPRLAEVAPVPVRPKVERVETVYRARRFMPRGSMVDVVG
ncbi:MAG: hypothetical protein BroJett004_13920 [Planctomycetota bacterium]|nr:MAG: hypothetical protein BroJett004_13920 [Planctomycetota bacterium]